MFIPGKGSRFTASLTPITRVRNVIQRFLDFARMTTIVIVEHANPLPLCDSGVSVVGDGNS